MELGGISRFPGPRIRRASQVQESLGLDSEICIFNECLRQHLVNRNISLVADKLPNLTLDGHKTTRNRRHQSHDSKGDIGDILVPPGPGCFLRLLIYPDGPFLKGLPPGPKVQPKALWTTGCPPVPIRGRARTPTGVPLALCSRNHLRETHSGKLSLRKVVAWLYHAGELQMRPFHVPSPGHKRTPLFTTNSAEINLSSRTAAKAFVLRKTNTLNTNNTFTFSLQK